MNNNYNSFYNKYTKRFFDLFFSVTLLFFLFPLLVFIALLIKLSSKGPAIFKTQRVGLNGKDFNFYKFRSMKIDAPKDLHPKYLDSEKCVTKIGSILRKTSLDELPQLYCVILGDMSIVGPRPTGKSEVELNLLRKKTDIFKVKPGITGLAQINGRNKLANNDNLKNEYDKKYINTISFVNDLKILVKTFFYVLKQKDIT